MPLYTTEGLKLSNHELIKVYNSAIIKGINKSVALTIKELQPFLSMVRVITYIMCIAIKFCLISDTLNFH